MNVNVSFWRADWRLVLCGLATMGAAMHALAQPVPGVAPTNTPAAASIMQEATADGRARAPVEIPAAVRALDGQLVLAQGNGYTVRLQDLREAASEFVSAGEQVRFWQAPHVMGEMVGSLYRQQVLAGKARAAKLTLPADAASLTAVQTNRELGNLYLLQEASKRMPEPAAIERYAKAQYEQAPSRYDHGEMFRVSHILVTVAEGGRTEEQARERAQSVIDRLAKGEDFGALAAEMSDDISSRNEKGALNYREADELPEDFVAVLKTMDVGSRSAKPVKTKAGYHVIWLQEKRPAGRLSFDDLREHLMTQAAETLAVRAKQAVWKEALDGISLNAAHLEQVATAMRTAK